jgi:hypothetical protein
MRASGEAPKDKHRASGETPKNKHQGPNKLQSSKAKQRPSAQGLILGVWDLFGPWSLPFGASRSGHSG